MSRPVEDLSRRDLAWLGAILVFAFALRLPGLNFPLWYDEIMTVETHLRLPWAQMLSDYSTNHHYLHNLFAKAAMAVFGEHPWAIRLPAMLMGVASVGAMWFLARMIAGTAVAHVTAILLALSYHHIWFSQNARGYTGLALFGTIGLLLFLRGMKSPDRGTWIWFAAMLAASVFTHLTGVFLFAALGFVWLGAALTDMADGTADRRRLGLPLMGFVLGGIATVVLYLPILPGIHESVTGVAETSAVDVMGEYQSVRWSALEAVRTALGQTGTLVAVAGLAAAALALLGAIASWRSWPLFPVSVAAAILLTVLVLKLVGMRVWPRFFFVEIGPILLLIVLGVRQVCGWIAALTGPGLGRLAFPVAALLMAAVSVPLALRNYALPKQDLAGAYAFVEETRTADERVIAPGFAGDAFIRHYGADWLRVDTPEEFEAAMAVPGPVTIVVAFPARVLRRIPALDPDTNADIRLVKVFPGTLGEGAVLVLRRD